MAAGFAGLSALALVLLPKCPLCVASYLAFATGICVSVAAAACLRMAAVTLCFGVLAFLACRIFMRALCQRALENCREPEGGEKAGSQARSPVIEH
jgi:hypothetical protein